MEKTEKRITKLIVGLGNPGIKYKKTRHNIGFMFVDELAKIMNEKFSLNKAMKCEFLETVLLDYKLIIIKPQTFMNASGEAVNLVKKYYNIADENIIVIYDDMDLPIGKIRIRPNGSNGGHKGMGSIINNLSTNEIKRIRIGIDRSSEDTIDYVLGKFSKDDSIAISLVTAKSLDMMKSYLSETFENFMNRYNKHE